MSDKIKLIGSPMQFIVTPDESYYDPATGFYLAKRPNPLCSGIHDLFDIYWEPCVDCEKFCNCQWEKKYPDVLVTSLDGATVKVSGYVVASSEVLSQLMDGHRKRARRVWLDNLPESLGLRERYELIRIEEDVTIYERIGEQNAQSPVPPISTEVSELSELFEFPQNTVYDLRNGSEPTFGLTTAQWSWLDKFICLHLDQVDENIAEERRAREYFRLSLYKRPGKDSINLWRYYDWEEDLFMNMSPEEMISVSQIKHELRICDLNVPVEKWFNLRRGIPMIEDFGWGRYRTDLTEELCRSGIEEFLLGRPRVTWNHSVSLHSKQFKLRKDDPRNALKFRKRIWQSWPHSNLNRYRRK